MFRRWLRWLRAARCIEQTCKRRAPGGVIIGSGLDCETLPLCDVHTKQVFAGGTLHLKNDSAITTASPAMIAHAERHYEHKTPRTS